MPWLYKVAGPFKDNEEAISHLVNTVCAEAEWRSAPLAEGDKQLLTGREELTEDFRLTIRRLVGDLLLKEPPDEYEADPRNFGNSLEWAWKSVPRSVWPNILVVSYEVAYENAHHHPELHDREFVIDQVKLWLSGILVVLLMLALVIAISFAVQK